MNRKKYLKEIESTFVECMKIVDKKSTDYSNPDDTFQNFETSKVVGVDPDRAILVRVMDKITRASNLLDREAVVVDEKIEDTIRDAINYLAILKTYLKNKK